MARAFLNWRGKECVSFWDGMEQYLLSGEISNYPALKEKLLAAEAEKREIEVEFVKKYRRKFVNHIK